MLSFGSLGAQDFGVGSIGAGLKVWDMRGH